MTLNYIKSLVYQLLILKLYTTYFKQRWALIICIFKLKYFYRAAQFHLLKLFIQMFYILLVMVPPVLSYSVDVQRNFVTLRLFLEGSILFFFNTNCDSFILFFHLVGLCSFYNL
jgi:hypothetical protein